MGSEKTLPLLVLMLTISAAALAALAHTTDVCIGEGTFNISSTVTLSTPEGNFTIDLLFLINITGSGNDYNVTVLGKIANITGPPVTLQTKLPLFDFTVSTEEGTYRWSDGKVFAAVLMPLSRGATYEMSITNIRTSCIRSIIIDASGLGIPNVVTISEGRAPVEIVYGFSQSTQASTTTAAQPGQQYSTTQPARTTAINENAPLVNAVYASADEGPRPEEEGIERNAVAAVIALLAAVGVGLLIYTLLT